jgi:hypothetical protein
MELVPIIVTALQVVIVIATIAIAISYISYKVRQKQGKTAKPSIADQSSNPKLAPIDLPKPILQNIPVEKKKTRAKTIVKAYAVVKEKTSRKPSHIPPPEKPKKNSSNRIEVMNKNSNEDSREKQKPIPKEENKKSTKKQSLGDNVLDKYAEADNNEMFTLKAESKDKKQ